MIIILLQSMFVTAWLVVLGRVFMSWIDPQGARPISQFLYRLTEPFLAPLRNVLPRTGQLDLSPLVLLIGLGFVMRIILAL